jgi:hypothetical protein
MKKLATMAIAGVMAASPALADLVFPPELPDRAPIAAGASPSRTATPITSRCSTSVTAASAA